MNQQLAKTQAEVVQITLKRDQAASIVQSYRSILHPLRRTPPEVLLEIFLYCVDFVDTEHPEACRMLDSLDTKRSPWNLGQVCKYWRSVVLESSGLWASLSLNLVKPPDVDPVQEKKFETRAVVLLSYYLRRSKDSPLSIALFASQPTTPLLFLICGHSHRWMDVLLSLPAEGFRSLSVVKGSLQILKLLHLRSTETSELEWDSMPVVDAFAFAPKLFLLRSHEIPEITTQFQLPWHQMTHCANHYSGGGVTSRNTINRSNMDILSKGSTLRSVTLTCAGSGPSLPITPLRHDLLSSLTIDLIRRSSPDLLIQLLDALTLPSLRYLRLGVSSRHLIRPDVRLIVRLIERSKCSLTKMRLKGFKTEIAGPDSPFHLLLSSVHDSMQILCLEHFPNSLLKILIATEDQPPLLPRLRHLRVSGPCQAELDQMLFVSMVESRVKHTKFGALVTSSQFLLSDPVAKTRLDELDDQYSIF